MSILGKRCKAGSEESDIDDRGRGIKVYLEMECRGWLRRFLLDSGCDATLLPAWYEVDARLNPTSKRAFVANSTEIELTGEVETSLKIGNLTLPTRVTVSDDVEIGLIGYDWLARYDVFWGFGRGKISIDLKIIPLTLKVVEEKLLGWWSTSVGTSGHSTRLNEGVE